MVNERKTEDIVRDHFKKFISEIVLEEQSSDNPKINKLLTSASKKGTGKGYPEFIIQFKDNPDLIIIVECKGDVTKHESKYRQQYKDFSVDGVLLYSSYLSRDYDVLSIAVSGQNESELKISHFLQLKGEKSPSEIFSNKLLPPDNYLQNYLKSPQKFRQDYDKLMVFTKQLNDNLHTLQIKEDLRAILISAILISLENKPFKETYKEYLNPKQLATFLIQTTLNQFESAKLSREKIDDLKLIYQQILLLDGLVSDIQNIRGLIQSIDENINDFIRTHEYFDVLGQLYIEFLRYANSDKGLGIVLTPPHITEFMAQLAEVNKNSVVYDSCTGTGGFLVSAMNLMIKNAKGDDEVIKNIKMKQLIGVENKSHIFALACSNMFIHQDGKTNILNGSCFDDQIKDKVRQYNPTVGLLNPPYKSDKKNDIEELDFVLINLECIEQGGKTVAIVPMSAALAQKGKVLELKRKLLEEHTLEAVLSMPDELFFNSKVGVVSCIMIFTAKRPHPVGKKTFFGYFKNDGFVKRKNKGRVDMFDKWKTIKEKWTISYMNREDIPGVSVNQAVSYKDEWCAESYMETDYTMLNREVFSKNVLLYTSFKLANQLLKDVTSKPLATNTIDIKATDWKYFGLAELFDISASRDELMDELEDNGETPYVTSSDGNNGITSYVQSEPTNSAGTITANRGGSVGYFFYQPVPYKATPVDVRILTAKFQMNPFIGLFLKTILQLEKYRYNYSRKMGSDRLAQIKIKLPSINQKPDLKFMENYIKTLPYSSSL